MTTDPKTITLHQTAPWNDRLTNPYRTRYATVDGRYFKVEADSLDAPWFVWEIDADDTAQAAQCVGIAFSLAQARAAIQARAAGGDEDAIEAAMSNTPRQGTGRNHPDNVARRQSWGQ